MRATREPIKRGENITYWHSTSPSPHPRNIPGIPTPVELAVHPRKTLAPSPPRRRTNGRFPTCGLWVRHVALPPLSEGDGKRESVRNDWGLSRTITSYYGGYPGEQMISVLSGRHVGGIPVACYLCQHDIRYYLLRFYYAIDLRAEVLTRFLCR